MFTTNQSKRVDSTSKTGQAFKNVANNVANSLKSEVIYGIYSNKNLEVSKFSAELDSAPGISFTLLLLFDYSHSYG